MIDAYRWQKGGGDLHDIVGRPSAALVAGVLLVADEVRALERQMGEDHRADAEAQRSGGGS